MKFAMSFQRGKLKQMRIDEKTKLPIFGVGPIYVISSLVLTLVGLAFDHYGLLESGRVAEVEIFMSALGFMFILFGCILWVKSVLIQRIGDEIKAGHLITDGVYSIVRNPIYSAFLFVFTGVLLASSNIYLWILPFVFWAYLTILMKCTEEKWLRHKFGEEYIAYCKEVNRVIPGFRKKKI